MSDLIKNALDGLFQKYGSTEIRQADVKPEHQGIFLRGVELALVRIESRTEVVTKKGKIDFYPEKVSTTTRRVNHFIKNWEG